MFPHNPLGLTICPIIAVGLMAHLSAASAELRPLVQLTLNGNPRNTGTLGGTAQMTEYVSGEGPSYSLGVARLGVSFANSSRSGGRDRTPAGGAVTFESPNLAGLRQFTLSLWFFPLGREGPARLLYLPGEWDLMIGKSRLSFKIESKDGEHYFGPPADGPPAAEQAWNFLAIAVDVDAGTGSMYLAPRNEPLQKVAQWTNLPAPAQGSGTLEIGNLAGIRPFKGLIDEVCIYDQTLNDKQVRALYESVFGPVRTLRDYAVSPQGSAAPGFRHSDVFFSTRWARENAIEMIRSFRANRVVWVYTSDPEFIAAVHGAGATIQATINSVTRTDDLSAYAIDLDGTKLVAPWMVNFNPKNPVKWGCPNQPAYREATIAKAKQALDAGADWMQFDDGALLVSCHSWGGGCMCDRCMEEFRKYLAGLPAEKLRAVGIESVEEFDYRRFLADHYGIRDAETYRMKRGSLSTTSLFEDWQRKSVRQWFQYLRRVMKAYAGRHVPLSINANLQDPSQSRSFLADLVDFFLGETWSLSLTDLAICARSVEALGKHQIVSPFPHNVNDTRIAIAATYALGEFCLVPWDIWMGPDKDRYFGTVDQYGDLYQFIRGNPDLFDDRENPGLVGVIVNTDRINRDRLQNITERLLKAQVPFSFVLVGHKYYDLPLDASHLRRFRLLVVLDHFDSFTPSDRKVLDTISQEVPILPSGEVSESLLREISPIQIWAPECLYVLPRVKPGGASRTLVCHVLNRLQAGDGKKVIPLRYVSFGLRGPALLGANVASAAWYAPGRKPESLQTEHLPGALRVIVPEITEWGIAKIEFGD